MSNIDTRETKFTDEEFDALPRNADGRILDDFDLVWIWATTSQKERMHGDDQTRGDELDEELSFLMADLF
jgi:hypothetical protein